MTWLRRIVATAGLASALSAGLTLVSAPMASAHPLGNFTVNRYSGLELAPGKLTIDYVLDMAEIPTFQERPNIDADRDGRISRAEGQAWADRKSAELLAGVSVGVGGRSVVMTVIADSMRLRPGQAGLSTLRLEAVFSSMVGREGALSYRDRNYSGRVGWKEITVRARQGVVVSGSGLPSTSISRALLAYPKDMLSSPLDVTAAGFLFHPGTGSVPADPRGDGATVSGVPIASGGRFTSLVTGRRLAVPVLALTLLLALGLGALHALGPGHGKTIVAAYVVGAGAGIGSVLAVGVAVSLMHTASVLTLGFITLFASRLFPPDLVFRWLQVASGLAGGVLGAWLLIHRWRARGRDGPASHTHSHGHGSTNPISRSGLAALAFSGGVLPSPTAVVVLLGALALHRLGYGLLLVGAFSVGLAAALTVVGLLAARAREFVFGRMGSRGMSILPLGSAGALAVAGLILTARAVIQLV